MDRSATDRRLSNKPCSGLCIHERKPPRPRTGRCRGVRNISSPGFPCFTPFFIHLNTRPCDLVSHSSAARNGYPEYEKCELPIQMNRANLRGAPLPNPRCVVLIRYFFAVEKLTEAACC